MKKLLFFSFLLFSYFSFSQEDGYQKEIKTTAFKVGLSGGANYSNIMNLISGNYKLGLDAGLSMEYDFSKKFGIEWDLMYWSRGYDSEILFYDNTGMEVGEADEKLKLNYFSIPIVTKFIFGSKVKYSFQAGIYSAILLGNTHEYEIYLDGEWSRIKSQMSGINQLDYGCVGGLSVDFPIKNNFYLGLSARYNYSLASIIGSSFNFQNTSAVLALNAVWKLPAYSPHKNY